MRLQALADSIIITGNFSDRTQPVAANLIVGNDVNLKSIGRDEQREYAAEVEMFLSQVMPAGIMISAHDVLHEKIVRLTELGDLFDGIAGEKLLQVVDPGLNAYVVQKNEIWKGGVQPIDVCLAFIQNAINYAKNPHVELSV